MVEGGQMICAVPAASSDQCARPTLNTVAIGLAGRTSGSRFRSAQIIAAVSRRHWHLR